MYMIKKMAFVAILLGSIASCSPQSSNEKNELDLKNDLLGNMLTGTTWRFDRLDEFSCFRIIKSESKPETGQVKYTTRMVLVPSKESWVVLANVGIDYAMEDGELVYKNNIYLFGGKYEASEQPNCADDQARSSVFKQAR